jgi:hypothetical protein
MNTTIIKLRGPDGATMFDLDELRRNLLRLSKSVEQPVEIIDLIGRFLNGRLACNFKCLTTGTANNRRIGFDFSQGLLALMTAMRAWDRNHDLVR